MERPLPWRRLGEGREVSVLLPESDFVAGLKDVVVVVVGVVAVEHADGGGAALAGGRSWGVEDMDSNTG